MDDQAGISESAYILGLAGLLPQVAALTTTLLGHGSAAGGSDLGPLFALGYACLILSFIGGIWWGFAMCRVAHQGMATIVAVIPSLFAAALILMTIAAPLSTRWALVLAGSAVIATLVIDRRLLDTGVMPPGWMALRMPLSLGLGTLTILTGISA